MIGNKAEVKAALLDRVRTGACLEHMEREAERLMKALDLVDAWVTRPLPSPDTSGSGRHEVP